MNNRDLKSLDDYLTDWYLEVLRQAFKELSNEWMINHSLISVSVDKEEFSNAYCIVFWKDSKVEEETSIPQYVCYQLSTGESIKIPIVVKYIKGK